MFVKTTDLHYEFRVKRHVLPKEIANLWDLDVKGPEDADWVHVVEADMLSTVIAKIGYVFEQDGL